MGREFELKFAADPAVIPEIVSKFGTFREIRMETTYFDTPEHSLSARRMTLRLRKENGLCVCTLKVPRADGSRGEWEAPAQDMGSGIAALILQGGPEILKELKPENLVAVCGARFTRLAKEVPTGDGTAELALDQGILLGGNRELPLCEVEVELKSGSDSAATVLAEGLAADFGLVKEEKSKFRRALTLAEGE